MEDKALFVRLPVAEADKLDKAAFALKTPKKDVIAALVSRHVDPNRLDELRRVVVELGGNDLTVGRADFRPLEAAEVLTLVEVADLLQVDEDAARELAEAGELPGRRIGDEWRFSRSAVLAWLGA